MPSKKIQKKHQSPAKTKREKWNDTSRAVSHLMEEELQGLMQYIRTLHYLAMILIFASLTALLFSMNVLFENEQHAVVGFLVVIATSLATIFSSLLVLKPWVLPRFLLPLNLQDISVNQLKDVMSHPDEYLDLLKHHIQIITENYLIPKLYHLRNSVAILVFGISTALVIAIALP